VAKQIAFADVILLNKTDLVSESVLEEFGGGSGMNALLLYHTMKS